MQTTGVIKFRWAKLSNFVRAENNYLLRGALKGAHAQLKPQQTFDAPIGFSAAAGGGDSDENRLRATLPNNRSASISEDQFSRRRGLFAQEEVVATEHIITTRGGGHYLRSPRHPILADANSARPYFVPFARHNRDLRRHYLRNYPVVQNTQTRHTLAHCHELD